MKHWAYLCLLASAEASPHQRLTQQGELEKEERTSPAWEVGRYHKTKELYAKLHDLQRTCKQHLRVEELDEPEIHAFESALDAEEDITAQQQKQQQEAPKLMMLTFNEHKPTNPKKEKKKALFNFGFHGRELITSETGLRLAELVCGKHAPPLQKRIDKVLQKVELRLVPVGGPSARVLAETHECQRVTARGEDLNRNWNHGWEDGDKDKNSDTFRGKSKQSAYEAATIAQVVKTHKPDLYLDVHSGARLLMTPFAHTDAEPKNYEKVMDNLQELNRKHCLTSPSGIGAHKKTLYQAHGTSIDYMQTMGWTGETADGKKQQGIPTNLLFELYVGGRSVGPEDDECGPQWMEDQERELEQLDEGKEFDKKTTVLRLGRPHVEADLERRDCFAMFNPTTMEDYDATVNKWSNALLSLLEQLGDGQYDEVPAKQPEDDAMGDA